MKQYTYLVCLFRIFKDFSNWDDIHKSYFIISTIIINIIQISICIELWSLQKIYVYALYMYIHTHTQFFHDIVEYYNYFTDYET